MFDERPIGDLIANQVGGGTPSRQVPAYWNGPIPWASVKDFTNGDSVISSTQESITVQGLSASASSLIPAGTLMICTRMAVGRSAFAPMDVAINQDVKALQPAVGTSRDYLLRLLQFVRPRAEAAAVGSTVKGIRIQDFLSILAPIAPALEQSCIAEILTALDTTIRQTEAIIEKLKLVKQALLHDLLTRGIDANGELRPPQSQAPHLYKDSPLGWIPNEWMVIGLADMASDSRVVLRTGPFGSSLKGEHFTESGRPVVTIGSLGVGKFIEDALLFVSEATAHALKDFELLPGDIAFSRVADVGRSVVVEAEQHGWIMSSNFMRIAVDTEKVEPHFLQTTLAFDTRLKRQMRSTINSAGRDVASSAIMMSLRFATPLIGEQSQIMIRMSVFDAHIEGEEASLQKLVTLKSGLMDDLLTGRVRVTPLLLEPLGP